MNVRLWWHFWTVQKTRGATWANLMGKCPSKLRLCPSKQSIIKFHLKHILILFLSKKQPTVSISLCSPYIHCKINSPTCYAAFKPFPSLCRTVCYNARACFQVGLFGKKKWMVWIGRLFLISISKQNVHKWNFTMQNYHLNLTVYCFCYRPAPQLRQP